MWYLALHQPIAWAPAYAAFRPVRVEALPRPSEKTAAKAPSGLLFPIEGGSGFAMILTRSMLCTQLYKTHLRHGVLKLDTPFSLPKDLTQSLGLTIHALPIGDYPIQEAEGFLRIDFKATNLK